MRFLLTWLVAGFSLNCMAQSTLPPLVASGTLIDEGIKLHDEKKYDEAISRYRQVSRNDTNYAWALSELSLTYTVQKDYEKAIEAAREGMKTNTAFTQDLYLKLGNALDGAGQSEKALTVYKEGLGKFPHSHQLYFEQGVALERMKRTTEAIQSFQAAIDRYFFHAGSHLALGRLCGENGYPVQGVLSLMTFLVLQPESDQATPALVFLEKFTTDEKYLTAASQPVGITDAFPEITRLVRSKLALNNGYELKTKMGYKAVRQIQLVLEKLPAASQNSGDFWVRTYAPLYHKLWQGGPYEAFTYYIMAPVDNTAAAKYKKEDKDIRLFRDWATEAFSQVNGYKKSNMTGNETICRHLYYSSGRLRMIAEKEDEKKKSYTGAFESYYPSGYLRSKGVYTADEKKSGEWRFFYPDGELDQIEKFTVPGSDFTYQSFYPGGMPKGEGRYVAGKRDGKFVAYSAGGAKVFEGDYKNGERHGKSKTFYADQTIKSETNFVNGLQDGAYRNFHPDGTLADEGTYRNGKEHGPYRSFHKNGKPAAQGTMTDGLMDGEWKWFHSNGKVAKSGLLRAGKQEGTWKLFFADGTLSQEFNNVNGLMEGIAKVYDSDGKLHFEQEYKAGKIRKYRYFDKQGKVKSEESTRGNKLRWATRFPSGIIQNEGEMADGKTEGKWKFYHESGYLSNESIYKADQQTGAEKFYFFDGSSSIEQEYKDGKLDGLHRKYHINGQLAAEGWYAAGARQGEWRTYYVNGKLKEKSFYLNDGPEGTQEYYHPDGKKHLEIVIKDGIINREIQYDTLGKVLHQVAIAKGCGPVELRHLNGKPMQKVTFRFGEKDGEEKDFYPSGKLREVTPYKFHSLHGLSERYHADGKLRSRAFYHLGQPDSTYQTWDERGRLDFSTCYRDGKSEGHIRWIYPNGKVETEGSEKNDEREGYFTYFTEEGTPQVRILYSRGLVRSYSHLDASGQWTAEIPVPNGTGKIKAYFQNGKVSYEGEMQNGKRVGVQRYYYPNGQLCTERAYVKGVLHGETKEYYANGKPRRIEGYYYDNRNGIWKEYRENGTLARETTYLMDLRHGMEREFDATGKAVAKRNNVYDEPYE
jgi:antitoxin component YwqK of YwqJK toxin-antitoxin module